MFVLLIHETFILINHVKSMRWRDWSFENWKSNWHWILDHTYVSDSKSLVGSLNFKLLVLILVIRICDNFFYSIPSQNEAKTPLLKLLKMTIFLSSFLFHFSCGGAKSRGHTFPTDFYWPIEYVCIWQYWTGPFRVCGVMGFMYIFDIKTVQMPKLIIFEV